ncbi:ABC transporter-like protein [Catenovulum agarivorans DS-2]|uniref:ABC transporter-like protein n=1 Tax=Catenovulum agarivorans DS-2 TaxID=1328313 RepID=W7QSG7_9ALTE|nr:ABC transporter ATP-binding protein [Catenovulum agarivorans]EWH11972.1 ABC transporter-like protein [Catenovulum agarivorans DS-2]
MKQDVIRMKGIKKVYLTNELETHALTNINLTIQQGEFVSIAGPSGCGKSTLLSIMGLLDNPTDGEYWLAEQDVSKLTQQQQTSIRNKAVGFIFQSFNLIADMNVFENVELPLVYSGMAKNERKQRVLEVLEQVQMSHRIKHLPNQLSGGQQQRVAIARALAGKPQILLADEPTGNLDSHNGEKAMELLAELHAQGTTICMVTHDDRYNSYATRIINLFDGSIVEEKAKLADIA